MPILAILILCFVLIPLLEIYLFLTVGSSIGVPATIAIVIFTGVLGAALAKHQGARAWQKINEAMAQGRVPGKELVDGVLILVAGIVLVTPGFATDLLGFSLLLPPVRAVVQQILTRRFQSKVRINFGPGGRPPPPVQEHDDIIEAESEIVDDARLPPKE